MVDFTNDSDGESVTDVGGGEEAPAAAAAGGGGVGNELAYTRPLLSST